MVLRDQMQKIALQWRAYGYRRIGQELKRRGYRVNHKRVLRLMRQDNLLCLRTTDSGDPFPVFSNLAATLVPSGINQLWVADITYIRLRSEFVYLAVVLDGYSRRVVGWALGRTLQAELALTALCMAVAERQPAAGLVHHSVYNDVGGVKSAKRQTGARTPESAPFRSRRNVFCVCHDQARVAVYVRVSLIVRSTRRSCHPSIRPLRRP